MLQFSIIFFILGNNIISSTIANLRKLFNEKLLSLIKSSRIIILQSIKMIKMGL